jgi:AraC family transcriptional regulator
MITDGKFARYKFCCPVDEYKQILLVVARHLDQVAGLKHRDGMYYFKFNSLPDYRNPDNVLIDWLPPVE